MLRPFVAGLRSWPLRLSALSITLLGCFLAYWFLVGHSPSGRSVIEQPVVASVLPAQDIAVSKPGQLDWTFVVGQQSVEISDNDQATSPTKYLLILPEGYDPGPAAPPRAVVLFVSAIDEPVAVAQWEPLCRKRGIIFATPYGAGNEHPPHERARVVLDVLADLRRNHRIEADRTYIGGTSGGARLAALVAFALPEYFGGVIASCAGVQPREEPWLRRRMTDLLSVAFITGEHDFNRTEVERYRAAMLADFGVRTRVWTVAGMGHDLPPSDTFDEAFSWLEADIEKRREARLPWPAMQVSSLETISREQWSQALLNEARLRLRSPDGPFSGLEQLDGIALRWPDLPAAVEAGQLLEEYDRGNGSAREEQQLVEERRFLLAEARALEAFATGPLPPVYAERRRGLTSQALGCWWKILQICRTVPDAAIATEAIERGKKLQAELTQSLGR